MDEIQRCMCCQGKSAFPKHRQPATNADGAEMGE